MSSNRVSGDPVGDRPNEGRIWILRMLQIISTSGENAEESGLHTVSSFFLQAAQEFWKLIRR